MLGEQFLKACSERGGKVAALALRYAGAGDDGARAAVEERLRATLPADLAVRLHMSDLGRRGGSRRSQVKAARARENGARGGRPRRKRTDKRRVSGARHRQSRQR